MGTGFWIVIQLHPWAMKTKLTKEISIEIRKKLKRKDLEVYYAVVEDPIAKKKRLSPFSEYFFVRYHDGMMLPDVKDEDFFNGILKIPGTDEPHLVPDSEIERLQAWVEAHRFERFRPGEKVKIIQGPSRNYHGVVDRTEDPGNGADPMVVVRVMFGDSEQEVILPAVWLKPKRRSRS